VTQHDLFGQKGEGAASTRYSAETDFNLVAVALLMPSPAT
jgi:hypothetical protein